MDYREIVPFKQPIDATITLPGSKSITNRAFLCAALASGKSVIRGALVSDDTRAMLNALHQLGVTNVHLDSGDRVVYGKGGQFRSGKTELNLGNAGTATRFLTALMILRTGDTVITGDKRMQQRPIADLVDALTQLGAKITYKKKKGCPPLLIKSAGLKIKDKELNIKIKADKSSQYLSALLMMAPLLPKPLRIEVIGELTSRPYIDVTLGVMKAFGVKVTNKKYSEFIIEPQTYKPCAFVVEGDATAASYFHSLNFLHGGHLQFSNLGLKSIQGDVDYPQKLKVLGKGIIDMNAMPDAAMTLAVTAPFAKKGTTEIAGVSTLKMKESDRLSALQKELKKVGVVAKITPDSITVPGGKNFESMKGNVLIKTYEDHRMAMCFAVMGTKIPGLRIVDPGCTSKTYPDFWNDLEKIYLKPLKPGKKNIVLIGMRTSGKNTLGKKIAKHLGRPFIDFDYLIQREAGMSTSEIVKKLGWNKFRKIEQKICSEFDKKQKGRGFKPSIIATGGGVILDPLNMKYLQKNALTIFIFTNPLTLIKRGAKDKNRPPLKKGRAPAAEVEAVWLERRDLYLKYADVAWDNTSGKVIEENLATIFG